MTPLVTLAFDPVAESSRELLPERSYQVQVVAVDSTKVSQAGNPKIEVQLGIVNDAEHTGRRLFDNLTLTPKAAWKLVQFMEAIKVSVSANFDPNDWIGKTCWVDVGQETYEGTARNKVGRYRAGN